MSVFKQVGDFLLKVLALARQFTLGFRRASASQFRLLYRQLFARLGDRPQDGVGEVFQHMELADLMRNRAKDGQNRRGIQRRTIGSDAAHGQVAGLQHGLKALEKGEHIVLSRIMV